MSEEPIREAVVCIPLPNGSMAIVDECDGHLAKYRWNTDYKGYVYRSKNENGKTRKQTLHREVLGLRHKDGWIGDHIDHDILNNRRSNLRIVDARGNSQNRRPLAKSGFRGVYLDEGRWRASAVLDGKHYYVKGSFKTPELAGTAAERLRHSLGFVGSELPLSGDGAGDDAGKRAPHA